MKDHTIIEHFSRLTLQLTTSGPDPVSRLNASVRVAGKRPAPVDCLLDVLMLQCFLQSIRDDVSQASNVVVHLKAVVVGLFEIACSIRDHGAADLRGQVGDVLDHSVREVHDLLTGVASLE